MVSTSFCLLSGLLSLIYPVLSITNPIYIITNAEQPSLSRPGLTPIGYKRANECLPELFSTLNIGKIIMCPQNDDSQVCFETLDTTQPTADYLGLPIDTSCGADENTDDNCVNDLLKKFAKNSTQSVLIVWDIQEIDALLGEDLDLDTDEADADDGIHFDLVTMVVKNKIKGIVSQNCTDIDGIAPGTGTVARKRSASTSFRSMGHRRFPAA
ncbi:hypothetical protein HYPSUDRAFT_66033 [Hypholoma sublateritium FD-334 SS-4]|uniref:Uncharacterized protein n=1 Tax=Hypholoma sublateritium (strain FD-334 SS-4) TaxID=945553 RepID=A0A0D2P5G6_HYPSF|nr:hypothetical protein HYPSUDRAFT_66033 [Hypholoma sublateritium FD-334 SS-4]